MTRAKAVGEEKSRIPNTKHTPEYNIDGKLLAKRYYVASAGYLNTGCLRLPAKSISRCKLEIGNLSFGKILVRLSSIKKRIFNRVWRGRLLKTKMVRQLIDASEASVSDVQRSQGASDRKRVRNFSIQIWERI